MTQYTDKFQDRQLYTDISAWITDAKVCPCWSGRVIMASTMGIRVRFDPFWRNLSSQQPVCFTNAQLTPMMNVGNVVI